MCCSWQRENTKMADTGLQHTGANSIRAHSHLDRLECAGEGVDSRVGVLSGEVSDVLRGWGHGDCRKEEKGDVVEVMPWLRKTQMPKKSWIRWYSAH